MLQFCPLLRRCWGRGEKRAATRKTASLEKLGDKRATGSKSHLEAQGLIAVINVFSLAAADSLFISCCRCPVIPVMDWIQSSLQHGVTNLLKGTTNPMIYACVEQGTIREQRRVGTFSYFTPFSKRVKNQEILEKWGKQIWALEFNNKKHIAPVKRNLISGWMWPSNIKGPLWWG